MISLVGNRMSDQEKRTNPKPLPSALYVHCPEATLGLAFLICIFEARAQSSRSLREIEFLLRIFYSIDCSCRGSGGGHSHTGGGWRGSTFPPRLYGSNDAEGYEVFEDVQRFFAPCISFLDINDFQRRRIKNRDHSYRKGKR